MTVTAEEEKLAVAKVYTNEMAVGDMWFLLDCKWWTQWKEYVHFDDNTSPGDQTTSERVVWYCYMSSIYVYHIYIYHICIGDRPGCINNEALFGVVVGEISKSARENEDYVFVNNKVWIRKILCTTTLYLVYICMMISLLCMLLCA